MKPFVRARLRNGLQLACYDRSCRYFGDYHRVRIEVRLSVPAPEGEPEVVKIHRLERMGVAGAEVLAVRDRLLEDFRRHATLYLERPDYPARLLAAARYPAPARSADGY